MKTKPIISYYFYRLADYIRYQDNINTSDIAPHTIPDIIYVPALQLLSMKCSAPRSYKLIAVLPYIMRGNAAEVFKTAFPKLCDITDGFLIQNIGDFEILKERCEINGIDMPPLFGDYALNVTNRATAEFLGVAADAAGAELHAVTLLPELGTEELFELAADFPHGIIPEICADDNIIVIRSEHCFAAEKEGYHCGRCGTLGDNAPSLCDIHGKIYPILCNPLDCNSVLLAPRHSGEKPLFSEQAQRRLELAESFTEKTGKPVAVRFSM